MTERQPCACQTRQLCKAFQGSQGWFIKRVIFLQWTAEMLSFLSSFRIESLQDLTGFIFIQAHVSSYKAFQESGDACCCLKEGGDNAGLTRLPPV